MPSFPASHFWQDLSLGIVIGFAVGLMLGSTVTYALIDVIRRRRAASSGRGFDLTPTAATSPDA